MRGTVVGEEEGTSDNNIGLMHIQSLSEMALQG